MTTDLLAESINFDPSDVSGTLLLSGLDAKEGTIGIVDSTTMLIGFQSLFQTLAGIYEPQILSDDFNLPVSLSPGS